MKDSVITMPEKLIVHNDDRGMQSLMSMLPPIAWRRLAGELLEHMRSSRILICTGFPVNAKAETDGPPGALILATSLRILSAKKVALVSMPDVLEKIDGLWDADSLEKICVDVGKKGTRTPGVPVTIEVCGRTSEGRYVNMAGQDITDAAPWLETVVGEKAFLSVGDGGNEFGFGSAPRAWFESRRMSRPVSTSRHLIPAQVSNWGALAIVAALEKLTGEHLMPEPEAYQLLLKQLAIHGMVDGVSGHQSPTEDGLGPAAATPVINALTAWAKQPFSA